MLRWMILILLILLRPFADNDLLAAGGNYPEKLQTRLQAFIRHDSTEQLHSAIEQYNHTANDPAGLAKAAQRFGLTTKDIQEISKHYSNESGNSQPQAEWIDEEIVIQNSGHRIAVSSKELWRQSIRVNEKIFQWNWYQTVAENLHRYDALFITDKTTLRMPDLITNAWADNLFRVKVAGLQLYFLVGSVGEIGGELYRLNTKVKEMMALCEAPEPALGQDDPFLKTVWQGTVDSQKYSGDPITLRNCNDVKAFSKNPIRVLQGEPVFPRLPADLCGNLDRLATCVHKQMDPPSVSTSKRKQPKDKEEWYEPKKATPGAARAQPAK